MNCKILVSPDLDLRTLEIEKILAQYQLKNPHPDLLFFDDDQKLGVEQAKEIRQFLSLKPYQAKGRRVVLVSAHNLTVDAQNALLKTLEEPPSESLIILGVEKEDQLLPTILSRCEVIRIRNQSLDFPEKDFSAEIARLLEASIKDRFEYIEKLEEKQEFLKALVEYYHQVITKNGGGPHSKSGDKQSSLKFIKLLLKAEEWKEANVNLRAILEYLMLEMP